MNRKVYVARVGGTTLEIGTNGIDTDISLSVIDAKTGRIDGVIETVLDRETTLSLMRFLNEWV